MLVLVESDLPRKTLLYRVINAIQKNGIRWLKSVPVKGKTFKETAIQYGTSVSTIIRRFDQIVPQSASEKQSLPKVIAIDEFKGNAGREKFQLIIADPLTREPIDVLPN